MFYSKSTGGFYDVAIHGENIPSDAVEVTAESHAALLAGQSAGKLISAGNDGVPMLIDPPAPTADQVVTQYESALQKALDVGAQSWGYDDIRAAISYVGDPYPRFDAESVALRNWRSAVWVWAGEQEAAIKAGSMPLPTPIDAFVAMMPAMPARPTA